MRYNDFVPYIAKKFPVVQDRTLAIDIADAMNDANNIGTSNTGSFMHEGVVYYIRTEWYDSCIPGIPCNPATCYTDWALTYSTC
jgi:hypothetical protein